MSGRIGSSIPNDTGIRRSSQAIGRGQLPSGHIREPFAALQSRQSGNQLFLCQLPPTFCHSNMIAATLANYSTAFRQGLTQPPPAHGRPASYMILFYRAECGLKALYTKAKNITAQPTGQHLNTLKTHNLPAIIKELKVPAAADIGDKGEFRLTRERTHPVSAWPKYPCADAHTVWRYGMAMTEDDELRIVQWLNRIVAHVSTNI